MTDRYQSPLSERYASKEMQYIFSPDKKFKDLEKTVDCSGGSRKRTGASHYGRTDRGTESVSG